MAQGVVYQNQRHHSLDNRHGAGQDAGVVASPRFQNCGVAIDVHRLLRPHDGRRRLKRTPDHDIFAVRWEENGAATFVSEEQKEIHVQMW